MKVSGDGQDEADQAKESGNGVNDKGDGDGVAEGGRKREVAGTVVVGKKTGCGTVSPRCLLADRRCNGNLHIEYPSAIGEHLVPRQKPKAPKSTPPYVPRGIALTIGVDRVESRRKAKAMKKSTDNGVAGRTMTDKPASRSSRRGGFGVEG